jgi:TetR/AcrR family transcriptional regulator, lmrAB and yxaGH operons repressor
MLTYDYQATGLTQVLAESSAPKGSLYFHFPGGKGQLAVEAVTAGATELRAVIESVFVGAASQSWTDLLVAQFSRWKIPERDRESLAAVALAGLEGALLLARVHRDLAPLRHFAKHIGALLTID